MSTSEEEYVTNNEVITQLQTIIEKVKSGDYNAGTKQDIYDCLNEYANGEESHPIATTNAITYLFRGLWLSQALDNPESQLNTCPYCLRDLRKE